MGPGKAMPSRVSAPVSRAMAVMNCPAKRKASCFPRFSRYSLNTGMKQAAMAEANTASKNTRGMRLAVKKALASGPTL